MKKILLVLLIACGLVSCLREKKVFLRSYIMSYYGIEGISLKEDSGERKSMSIYGTDAYFLGDYKSTGTEKGVYDALCEKHGDMTFLRDFFIRDGFGPHSTDAIGVDFLSIDITSDSPFDEEHPAGVSLGDIVKLSSYSLKPYIDSGYTYINNYGYHRNYHSFDKYFSELTSDDLMLLGRSAYIGDLEFDGEPTLSKTHTFTVTMTADDGRVFTASIEMTFE
jgi:hypothetical protein